MLKKIILISLVVLKVTACVSSKLYKELEGNYSKLKSDYDALSLKNDNEYAPVDSNKTTDRKAKNRRINMVITPKLDKIFKIHNRI